MPAPYVAGTFTDTSRTDGASWSGSGPYTATLEIPAGSPPPYDVSNYADFDDFGPSPNIPKYVPLDATNLVVRFKLARHVASGVATVKDDTIQPLHNGSASGLTNLADTVTAWPGSSTDAFYDAEDYTPAQVNSGLLGLRIGATATGTAGQIGNVSIVVPEIVSITFDIPNIQCVEAAVSDDDGYGSDNGTAFDDAGDFMRVGITEGMEPPPDERYAFWLKLRDLQIPEGSTILTCTINLFDRGSTGTGIDCEIGIVTGVDPAVPADATELFDLIDNDMLATYRIQAIDTSSPSPPYPVLTLQGLDPSDLAPLLQAYIDQAGYEAARSANGANPLFAVYPDPDDVSIGYGTHDFGTGDDDELGYITVTYTPPAAETLATGTVYQMLVLGML